MRLIVSDWDRRQEHFESLDVNGDNCLSADEFERAASRMNRRSSENGLEALVSMMKEAGIAVEDPRNEESKRAILKAREDEAKGDYVGALKKLEGMEPFDEVRPPP